jgi:hypothetical protein
MTGKKGRREREEPALIPLAVYRDGVSRVRSSIDFYT